MGRGWKLVDGGRDKRIRGRAKGMREERKEDT